MTSVEKWEAIKRDYSQSGLFDNASGLENELDRDVAEMLKMAREEGIDSLDPAMSLPELAFLPRDKRIAYLKEKREMPA
jgi:hypothetical protein